MPAPETRPEAARSNSGAGPRNHRSCGSSVLLTPSLATEFMPSPAVHAACLRPVDVRRLCNLPGVQRQPKRLPTAGRIPLTAAIDDAVAHLVDDDAVDPEVIAGPQRRAVRL